MSEQSTDRPLVFSVVEDDGENVTIEISEEDYQRDLAAGIDENVILKPGDKAGRVRAETDITDCTQIMKLRFKLDRNISDNRRHLIPTSE
jgi:hypothetical protein